MPSLSFESLSPLPPFDEEDDFPSAIPLPLPLSPPPSLPPDNVVVPPDEGAERPEEKPEINNRPLILKGYRMHSMLFPIISNALPDLFIWRAVYLLGL